MRSVRQQVAVQLLTSCAASCLFPAMAQSLNHAQAMALAIPKSPVFALAARATEVLTALRNMRSSSVSTSRHSISLALRATSSNTMREPKQAMNSSLFSRMPTRWMFSSAQAYHQTPTSSAMTLKSKVKHT